MSTALKVVVDTDNGLAPWRQVHAQILRAITAGALHEGTRLPPIRQLARDLGLAVGTVARAYRELENDGWVTTARAKGTVVAPTRSDPDALLRSAAEEFATRARELGADIEKAIAAVRAGY